jgi:hypothetical protein
LKNTGTLVFYGLLILAAAVIGLRARQPGSTSRVPSVTNPGPLGLKALFLFLEEGGHDVRSFFAPLTELPSTAKTVVLAGPVAREVSSEEVSALRRLVEGGGTLVYFLPSEGRPQTPLEDWLQIRPAPFRLPDRLSPEHTLEVWQARGPFSGLRALRTSSAPRALLLDAMGALAVAGEGEDAFVAYLPLGRGQVYVFSSPDVGQNRFLDQGDNLGFWDALARRGPLLFDEWHHQPPSPPPASPALWGVLGQLGLLAGAVFWSRGVRLGPPRPVVSERHRSTREYLASFGWLLRRGQVERELLASLKARVRRTLWEEAAISPHASSNEAALQWAQRTGELPERFLEWEQALDAAVVSPRIGARTFAQLTTDGARLEECLHAAAQAQ